MNTSPVIANEPTGYVPDAGRRQNHDSDGWRLRIADMRAAQMRWKNVSLSRRLQILRRARQAMAQDVSSLAEALSREKHQSVRDCLTAEILPTLDACRFLEREAQKRLAPRNLGALGRPAWLGRVRTIIEREPHGLVLIVSPSNYPFFLPAVQVLQALAAGNAILIKPAPLGTPAALALQNFLLQAGLDERLVQVLPESVASAASALKAGVDLAVVTGSEATGRAVMQSLENHLIPTILELSGCDPVLVCDDADLELTARALVFGLTLNQGQTCIAPHRVFVTRPRATELEGRLSSLLRELPAMALPDRLVASWLPWLTRAIQRGAHLVSGQVLADQKIVRGPLILAGLTEYENGSEPPMFGPIMTLTVVDTETEALRLANESRWALGATIFSRDEERARRLARKLDAGVTVINDMIVPSADPRVPFGGSKRSGYGVTRGAEGLIAMTRPKVVTVTRGGRRRHLESPRAIDDQLIAYYIQVAHGRGWLARFHALLNLIQTCFKRSSPPSGPKKDSL